MAESQEPIESLVKKEAEPQRDPIVSRSTSAILLLCTLLLIGSAGWALYDEGFGQRPWRGMQQEFVKRYTAYLKSIRKDAGKSEADVKETPEYQQLDEAAKAALDKVKADIAERDRHVAQIQAKLDAVTLLISSRSRPAISGASVTIASSTRKRRKSLQLICLRTEAASQFGRR